MQMVRLTECGRCSGQHKESEHNRPHMAYVWKFVKFAPVVSGRTRTCLDGL
jgi:hypothetical protein